MNLIRILKRNKIIYATTTIVIVGLVFIFKYIGLKPTSQRYIITEWEVFHRDFLQDEFDKQFTSVKKIRDTLLLNENQYQHKNENEYINQLIFYERELKKIWKDENICLEDSMINIENSSIIPLNYIEYRVSDSNFKFISFSAVLFKQNNYLNSLSFDFNPKFGCMIAFFGNQYDYYKKQRIIELYDGEEKVLYDFTQVKFYSSNHIKVINDLINW